MKILRKLLLGGLIFIIGGNLLFAQQLDFTLQYNATNNEYEVYGKSNASFSDYFVGGGSQLSIVLPSFIADGPLLINTVNGGIWTDNSQIFAPAVMPNHDFHSIATNGSRMDWIFGIETLLFTFSIPNQACVPGIRLFENDNDPSSVEPSMLGADFKNYFANVFTFEDNYRANYDNFGISCGIPVIVAPDTIYIPQDSILVTCLPFNDSDNTDTHTFDFCDELDNGLITGSIDNSSDEVCLTLQPEAGFSGLDQFCIIVCDQTGLCDSVTIPVVVIPFIPNSPPSITDDTLVISENTIGNICLPIQDADANDMFSTIVCSIKNGVVNLDQSLANMVCIRYVPENNFTGTDEICLITCDALGLCDTAQVIVLVQEDCPSEELLISVSNSVCSDELIQFSAIPLNQSNIIYTWLNGRGETISNQLAFGLNANDNKAIPPFSLQAKKGTCPVIFSETVAVTIRSSPSIINLAASTNNVCIGGKLTMRGQSNNPTGQIINYTWTGPNGMLETGQTTSDIVEINLENLTATQMGTYTLTLDNNDGCSTTSQSIIIQSTNSIEAPVLTALQNIVCSGKDVELTATIQDNAEIEFEWFLQADNGDLSYLITTEHPSLVYEAATSIHSGNYLVRTKKGDCVSGFSNTEIITVFDANTEISITHDATILNPACLGSSLQLSTIFYENATYQWSGPNGFTATVPNPVINNISGLDAGAYQVVVTIDGCDPVSAAPSSVYVNTVQERPILQAITEICEGENLTLTVVNPLQNDDEQAQYDWYFSGTTGPIAITQTPSFDIGVASDKYAGNYYVIQTIYGCSLSSDTLSIQISPTLNLTAQTIDDIELCRAAAVDLIATVPDAGLGKWTSPTGAFILNPNETVTVATDLQAGLNEFIWTVKDDCSNEASDTFRVNIQGLTSDIAFAGLDQQFCELSSTQLNANPLIRASGIWTQSLEQASQGIIIESPENANTVINGLQSGNAYTFTWTISEGVCADFDTDEVTIIIDELPNEAPFILTEAIRLCENEQVTLEATMPLFSTGEWTTTTNAIIANPFSSTTTISNLQSGDNQFIWSLSSASCINYASDTLNVFLGSGFAANSDFYNVNFNDSIIIDVLINDSISNIEDYNFIITKYPDFGNLVAEENGNLRYIPFRNFFGADNFRYKLCSTTCESVCDTARVDFQVTAASGSGICFVPNGLTPNGDNVNDQLIIPCLFGNTTSEITIFNRWGDEVYSAAPYLNDWEATHEGKPLPSGTYFYILKVDQNDPEAIQGYLTVFR